MKNFFKVFVLKLIVHVKMGYVCDLLLWLSGHSQMLAHQLLWNMDTNMYMDEDSKVKDPVLYDALSDISKKVHMIKDLANGYIIYN